MTTVPRLEDYDISPETGFLPQELPLIRLPQEYYQPWEVLLDNLPHLLMTQTVRKHIQKLPNLTTDQLSNVREYRRAYQCLSFLAHAYIWGTSSEPLDRLCAQIADPLVKVSNYLGLPPLATYAGLCMWNFKTIMPLKESETNPWWDNLDNLSTINTYTGSFDESWFYIVSVYFEKFGANVINTGIELFANCVHDEPEKLALNLQKLAELIDVLGSVVLKMEEMCDPHTFYFRIRPYLAGWLNMADAGLHKDGVFYEGQTNMRFKLAGGSNAQSSLVQFIDSLLGIKHYSTGERPLQKELRRNEQSSSAAPQSSFMNDMQNYMPRKHREFLQVLEATSPIHEYVKANSEKHPGLIISYDGALAMMKLFRDKHIQIVTRYIVLQAKQSNKLGSSTTLRSGLARRKKEERGTGGTSLLPFLKQCRDETGDPAVGTWGKRILTDGVMQLKYSQKNGINED